MSQQGHCRTALGWGSLGLAMVLLLSCTPSASGDPTPTVLILESPPPTPTIPSQHATAVAAMNTAVAFERRGALSQALEHARAVLVLSSVEPQDARLAADYLTRAPLRATWTAEDMLRASATPIPSRSSDAGGTFTGTGAGQQQLGTPATFPPAPRP